MKFNDSNISLFQQSYRDRHGVLKRSNKWSARITQNGVTHQIPTGCENYDEALSIAKFTSSKPLAKIERSAMAKLTSSNPRSLAKIVRAAHELKSTSEVFSGTIGAMSELLVCVELLNRGYEVFRAMSPSSSCDLIAFNGASCIRVEVKTSSERNGKHCKPAIKQSSKAYDCLAFMVRDVGILFDPEMPPCKPSTRQVLDTPNGLDPQYVSY